MEPRHSTPADAAAMRAIAEAAYAKYIARMGRRPRPMDADFEAAAAADETWVIEAADGSVAGYSINELYDDHLLVENLGVAPEHQGHGFGRRLLAQDEARAVELSLAEVRLYTHVTMVENVAFYTRYGFHETHRDDERVFMAKSPAAG